MEGSNLKTKVRALRRERGLTLDELATQTGSSKSYIWDLENKDGTRPSGDKLSKIAKVLGVTPEYLLDDTRTDPTIEDRDQAFFRKFEAAKPEVKDKIKRILDVLDEE